MFDLHWLGRFVECYCCLMVGGAGLCWICIREAQADLEHTGTLSPTSRSRVPGHACHVLDPVNRAWRVVLGTENVIKHKLVDVYCSLFAIRPWQFRFM